MAAEEEVMPKYLFEASFSPEAAQGLKKAGAASRPKAVSEMCADVGGSLEAFYFAFGDVDALVICDLPDDEAAAAVSFAVSSSGTVGIKTVKLMTVEELDSALKRSVGYRPPGS
jgi:uncharacterized protein with GYD domain